MIDDEKDDRAEYENFWTAIMLRLLVTSIGLCAVLFTWWWFGTLLTPWTAALATFIAFFSIPRMLERGLYRLMNTLFGVED